MHFVFDGTPEELVAAIRARTRKWRKNIRLGNLQSDRIDIGFQRLGHNGGRWLIAEMSFDNGKTTISGEFSNVFHQYAQKPPGAQGDSKSSFIATVILGLLLLYLIWLIIPVALWLLIFGKKLLFVPFLAVAVLLFPQALASKTPHASDDRKFIRFMTRKVGCEFHP